MRRALVAALAVLALAGCASSVRGIAAPAAPVTTAAPSSTAPPSASLPGGASPSCKVAADGCDDDEGATTVPAGLVCDPLPSAMAGFDAEARAVVGGDVGLPGSGSEESALADVVFDVVDACGYQVMVDVADQYPQPLYGWLRETAVTGLGEIGALPGGLRCAELQALGLGPKQAVDYWFLWDAPALMDADLDGVPCETVWTDVAQYLPAYY